MLFLIINLIVKKEQTLNEPEDLCNVCSKNIRVKIPFVFFSLKYKKNICDLYKNKLLANIHYQYSSKIKNASFIFALHEDK